MRWPFGQLTWPLNPPKKQKQTKHEKKSQKKEGLVNTGGLATGFRGKKPFSDHSFSLILTFSSLEHHCWNFRVAETTSMDINQDFWGPFWKMRGFGVAACFKDRFSATLSLSFSGVWCWGCGAWLTNRLTLHDGFELQGHMCPHGGLLGQCGCVRGAPKFRGECPKPQTSTMPWWMLCTLSQLYPFTNSCYQSGTLLSQMKQRWRSELRTYPRPPVQENQTHNFLAGRFPREFSTIFRPFSEYFLRAFSEHFQTIFSVGRLFFLCPSDFRHGPGRTHPQPQKSLWEGGCVFLREPPPQKRPCKPAKSSQWSKHWSAGRTTPQNVQMALRTEPHKNLSSSRSIEVAIPAAFLWMHPLRPSFGERQNVTMISAPKCSQRGGWDQISIPGPSIQVVCTCSRVCSSSWGVWRWTSLFLLRQGGSTAAGGPLAPRHFSYVPLFHVDSKTPFLGSRSKNGFFTYASVAVTAGLKV